MKRLFSRPGLVSLFACASLLGCGAEGYSGSYDGGAGGGGGASSNGGGTSSALGKRSGGSGEQRPEADTTATGGSASELECTAASTSLAFFMSADDSNSMASPVLAREWLTANQAPPASQIRTYEFLNYYNSLYDIADTADNLEVHAELHPILLPDGTATQRYRLQVGVQAFQVERPQLVITYVVDTSGSLVGAGLERERAAILGIADHLRAGDIVNVVTWSTKENILLEGYEAKGDSSDQGVLATVVNQILPGGGSDLHAGLTKAYEIAESHFDQAKLNRVVLLSDGGANLGVLDRDSIAKAAAQAQDEGIYLVGIGVGPAAAYSDTLMDLVTDAGRGAYVFLDSPLEANALFTDRFDEIMNVAARAVHVEVDLPPYLEIDHFYGEAYADTPESIEPQNLAPGDSMIFNQTLYVTNAKPICAVDTIAVHVKWETPITHDARQADFKETPIGDLLALKPSPQMTKADAVIAYAEALKSGDADELKAALEVVSNAEKDYPNDKDLVEIKGLLSLHPALNAN